MTAQSANPDMLPDHLRHALHGAEAQVNSLVLGKAQAVRFAFTALSDAPAIEDLQGWQETLAHALAARWAWAPAGQSPTTCCPRNRRVSV